MEIQDLADPSRSAPPSAHCSPRAPQGALREGIAALLCWSVLVGGCGGATTRSDATGPDGTGGTSSGDATGGTSSGAPEAVCPENARVVLNEAVNYSFRGEFHFPSVELRSNTNLLFDWSGVTEDFLGRPVDPVEDIDEVIVTSWDETPAELERMLSNDDFEISIAMLLTAFPDERPAGEVMTSERLVDLTEFGNELPDGDVLERFDASWGQTYLVSAATDHLPAGQVRMLGIFTLSENSTTTTMSLTSSSTAYDFGVEIAGRPSVPVPPATPSLTLDWGEMTTNALGKPFDPTEITEVVVAHFPGLTPGDLERNFSTLPSLAEGWWSGEVLVGDSLDLSQLVDASGVPFPGIDDEGCWVVAAYCGTNCWNPAPWSLTLLTPCQ